MKKMKLHGFTPMVSKEAVERNPPKQKSIHPRLDRRGLLRRRIKLNWKLDSEENVLSYDLFDVYKQHIRGPHNWKRDYQVVKRRPTVSVIPLTDDNHIFIVGQERYLLGKFAWELMAGFIEYNETPLIAAQRELKEETGIIAKKWRKLAQIEMSATAIRAVSHLFLAQDLNFEKAEPEEGEELEIKKITLDDALNYVLDGRINNAVSMTGILLLNQLLREKKL